MYVKESAPDLIFLACCGLAQGSRIANGERSGQSVGDEASQWKRPKFDPSLLGNPLTDIHKNWHA